MNFVRKSCPSENLKTLAIFFTSMLFLKLQMTKAELSVVLSNKVLVKETLNWCCSTVVIVSIYFTKH